jgi:hypothetical protein
MNHLSFKGLYWIGLIITVSLLFSSCAYHNEEEYFSDYSCDTSAIVYHDLTYIFSDICANCHNSTFTYREEIRMDTYSLVVESISTGLVWQAINHQDGVTPMPYQREKLSDCDLLKINSWISNDMPE